METAGYGSSLQLPPALPAMRPRVQTSRSAISGEFGETTPMWPLALVLLARQPLAFGATTSHVGVLHGRDHHGVGPSLGYEEQEQDGSTGVFWRCPSSMATDVRSLLKMVLSMASR